MSLFRPQRFLWCLLALLALPVAAGAAPIKYSLSVFHFNIEYVIGGLYGFLPFDLNYPGWEIGPDEAEDMIIVESFAPVLDLLDKHPEWTLTLEMQAYFVEVLAERHPDTLDQLRDLVDSGNVELVSFHYADQLFIAYPYEDWQRSNDRTQAVMEEHGLTLSPVVFCQEGQGAEGMARRMEESGYEIMAWPVNLWKVQHGEWDPAPYYNFGDVLLVTASRDVNDSVNDVYTKWNFLNDGELMATGDWDPYFPWFFRYREEAVAEYEAKLLGHEADDYIIGGIGEYVDALIDAGIQPADPPPLLDGTWQPDSTRGTSRWLGYRGLWGKDERDNHVRSFAYIAHKELKAAETIAAAAGLDREAELDEAWRNAHRSQVSDGSGINPYRGEVEFCIASAAEAIRVAADIIAEAKEVLGEEHVLIDTGSGNVTAGEYHAPGELATAGPFDLAIDAPARGYETRWYKVSESPTTWRLQIDFSRGDFAFARRTFVRFPGTGDEIKTTTALIDDEIQTYSRSDFVFDWWFLPGPIGLIGLGDGWWVIKDTSTVHVAAEITSADSDVTFEDMSVPYFESATWVFYVLEGSDDEALNLADRINVHPTLAR
ncbi:MAG: hypothetical protein P9L99_16105 [Candidatus Lernaella stagnicola]|nr:hypothetical protein [Candidatus Lernaella stagnicola]